MNLLVPLLLGSTAVFVTNINKPKSGQSTKSEEFLNNTCKHRVDDILKKRTYDGLTKETQDLINLVTLDKNIFPVGSFKYKAHRYPSDIDIFEPIKACCDKESASQAIANKISAMAKKIQSTSDVYLGDFKAGLDDRYNINNIQELDKLLKEELITKKEYDMAKKQKTPEDLQEYMRQFRIVRWTLPELIQGYKILPKGIKLTLADALTDKTIVKIDLWSSLNGNYNETTNFFLIIMKDKQGNETVLNEELGDRLYSLNHDIIKYGSGKNKNSLKFAKRLWNRALFLNDKSMLYKLYPLFQSGANSLNQIAGEAEVIRMMVNKLDNPPIEKLLNQIDGFKRRITDVFDIDFNAQPMYDVIDKILSGKIDIIKGLENLESMLKKAVEEYSNEYIKCKLSNSKQIIDEAKIMENKMKQPSPDDLDEMEELDEIYD